MSERGFTLIEVLVASVLVVVALLGAATMSLTASSQVNRGAQETLAVSMGEQRLEFLKNQAYASANLAAGTTTQTLTGDFLGYVRTTTITDNVPQANVKSIVIVTTTPSGMSCTITGLVANDP